MTGGNYQPLIYRGAAYQVTAGKTLYCNGFWFRATTGGGYIQFGYGSAASAANAASPPSGAVEYATSSTMSTGAPLRGGSLVGDYYWYPFFQTFPAASYPYMRYATSEYAAMSLDCFEQ